MPIDNILRSVLKNADNAAKKSVRNGIRKGAKNGLRNGINGLTEGNLAKQTFVNEHLAKRAAQSKQEVLARIEAGVAESEAVVLETNREAVEVATDQHLKKQQLRGVISVEQPLEDLEKGLVKSLRNAGVTGDINLQYPKRRAGPLGEATTLYRNYGQEWLTKTDKPQKQSLYAAKDGERYFTDMKDKSTGRLAIRELGQKLDEVIGQNDWRGIAIAEQTLDPKAHKAWNQALRSERGWEAHHLNMIKLISNIVTGMSLEGRKAVYRHLGRRYNLWTGNSVFNKVNLPPDIHDWVHAEMTKIGLDFRKIVFDENTPIKKRLKYIKLYAKKMDHIQRYIYKKMQGRKEVVSKLRPESRQFRAN